MQSPCPTSKNDLTRIHNYFSRSYRLHGHFSAMKNLFAPFLMLALSVFSDSAIAQWQCDGQCVTDVDAWCASELPPESSTAVTCTDTDASTYQGQRVISWSNPQRQGGSCRGDRTITTCGNADTAPFQGYASCSFTGVPCPTPTPEPICEAGVTDTNDIYQQYDACSTRECQLNNISCNEDGSQCTGTQTGALCTDTPYDDQNGCPNDLDCDGYPDNTDECPDEFSNDSSGCRPEPSPTIEPTPTPDPSASPTPDPSPSPSPSPSASPSPSPSASPTVSPTSSPDPSGSPQPTSSPCTGSGCNNGGGGGDDPVPTPPAPTASPGTIGGGGDCGTPPECSGDPIQCYQAQQLWELECETEDWEIQTDAEGMFAPAIDEGLKGIEPGEESVIDEINESYFAEISARVTQSFTGSCSISDEPISLIDGIVVDFPFSDFCDLFLMIRIFVMSAAGFIAFRIAVGVTGVEVN